MKNIQSKEFEKKEVTSEELVKIVGGAVERYYTTFYYDSTYYFFTDTNTKADWEEDGPKKVKGP